MPLLLSNRQHRFYPASMLMVLFLGLLISFVTPEVAPTAYAASLAPGHVHSGGGCPEQIYGISPDADTASDVLVAGMEDRGYGYSFA